MSFAEDTKLKSQAKIFFETGTFHGAGVSRALSAGYKKVISIEVFEPLYKKTWRNLKKK